MTSYDVVVLGAGPGGYVAAVRAAQLGLRTAIVERRFWGGVCLNVGCIPSKALLRNAELVHLLRHDARTFGIGGMDALTFDFAEAVARSRRVADGRAKGVRYLMRKNHVAELEGTGEFVDAHTMEITAVGGERSRIGFEHAIVATGATPRRLPGVPEGPRVVTYEAQILSTERPARLVIVGGGAIGVEFATMVSSYGTEVTILEAAPRVLPLEDEEVALFVRKQLERSGIRIHTGARVEGIEDTGADVGVRATTPEGPTTLSADRVLVAIGFEPRSAGFGLTETLGVAVDARGAVLVDGSLRTNVPHVFAIGDVTGRLMLAHAAEAMALVAAETIAGHRPAPLDFEAMPRVTFCRPQVASFGPTEAAARARGLDVTVAKFPFLANGKAQGLGDPQGFVKLVGERASGRLLGAHLVGPDVGELLPELTLAHAHELGAEEVARNVHAHPTLAEAVKDAAHGLGGGFINL
jgi:dihydrolipoamide dehydrogenase